MWLVWLAKISIILALACAGIVLLDIAAGRRQRMWIMNVVWPLTVLYAGPIGLGAYFFLGRAHRQQRHERDGAHDQRRPFWRSVVLGTTHCGSGCTLGDLVAETFVVVFPLSLFGRAIFGTWVLDFVLAFLFGIAFQYFTIKPMRNLSVRAGLKAALKADAMSLTAWQVGMYGWMAIAVFAIFDRELSKSDPLFWFMMQIAMLVGFLTSYPVNAWLIREGWKERM